MMNRKTAWLYSAALLAISTPAFAQRPVAPSEPDTAPPTHSGNSQTGSGGEQTAGSQDVPTGDIVVTATRRNEALSNIPLAVSAVTSQTLENTGASDIRQLNQVSPSLLVSSTSSEAGAAVARIRGIGTVGDNPGLEGSVGVFVDGVYRSRTGSALTELGALDRIEVLRGPQGTLFGRNTSAGLISIITARPRFEPEVSSQIDIGNYGLLRSEVGVTGGLSSTIAARLDMVSMRRKGFLKDIISGRRLNDRARWLLRGQLLFQPNSNLSVRVIGDYSSRKEECCGAIYAPLINYQRDPGTPPGQIGTITTIPAPFAATLRTLRDPAGNPVFLNDDINRREMAITPGRDYHTNVKDRGLSAEAVYDLGAAELTSITAYRYNDVKRGADADFNNYDILYRDAERRQFRTFTQEVRLQGDALNDRLDWLVGAYYANERINVHDNLRFGTQYGPYANLTVAASLPAFPLLGGFANLPGVVNALLLANPLVTAPARAAVVAQVQPVFLSNVGIAGDDFTQRARNFALFTHNIFKVTDQLNLTIGLRYTTERKRLFADLNSDNLGCASITGSITRLRTLAVTTPALAAVANSIATQLTGLAPLACVANLNTTVDGDYSGSRSEHKLSGTAVISYRPIPRLLTYASYSRGYKAGGYNFDRSALIASAPNISQLEFEPENVDAFELGAKYNSRVIDVNVAAFYQVFDQFQLNTFNGINFLVENIQSCSRPLTTPPPGNVYGPCGAENVRAGVTSKGVELETYFYPRSDLQFAAGVTYANTRYRNRLVGLNGRPLVNDLFVLPGHRLSNSAALVVTGSATYNPVISSNGMRALFYLDGRRQSRINTGSDLDIEKFQPAFTLFNARVGIQGPERAWSVELWSQNLFNKDYSQVIFDAPFQPLGGPAGSRVALRPKGSVYAVDRSSALFGRFLGEPRTFGLTLRSKMGFGRKASPAYVAPPAPPPPAVIEPVAPAAPPPPPPVTSGQRG